MTIQPPLPPQPKVTVRSVLTTVLDRERAHWSALSLSTLCGLLLPSICLLAFSPLLPPVAYLLQRWAGSSWTWRDRWASVRTWAEYGSWFVGGLCILALLADAHVWFIPGLMAWAQSAWHSIDLPGELALFPLRGTTVLARTILFLPLAPALALLYERIDPRTRADLQRVLSPSDLVPPPPPEPVPAQETPQQTTPPASPAPSDAQPSAPAQKKRPRATAGGRGNATAALEATQLTIESVLVADRGQATPLHPKKPRRKKQEKQAPSSLTPVSQEQPLLAQQRPAKINWDDVAE